MIPVTENLQDFEIDTLRIRDSFYEYYPNIVVRDSLEYLEIWKE